MTVIERIFSIMREKKLSAYALFKETGIGKKGKENRAQKLSAQ